MTAKRGGLGWGARRKFKEEGTHVYLWLTHTVGWQKPTQHCTAIFLQLKINVKKEKKKKLTIKDLVTIFIKWT